MPVMSLSHDAAVKLMPLSCIAVLVVPSATTHLRIERLVRSHSPPAYNAETLAHTAIGLNVVNR